MPTHIRAPGQKVRALVVLSPHDVASLSGYGAFSLSGGWPWRSPFLRPWLRCFDLLRSVVPWLPACDSFQIWLQFSRSGLSLPRFLLAKHLFGVIASFVSQGRGFEALSAEFITEGL